VITVLPNTAVPPVTRPPVTTLPSAGQGGYDQPLNALAVAMIAASVVALGLMSVRFLFDGPQGNNNRYRRP
jgi:hypothetical protein